MDIVGGLVLGFLFGIIVTVLAVKAQIAVLWRQVAARDRLMRQDALTIKRLRKSEGELRALRARMRRESETKPTTDEEQ